MAEDIELCKAAGQVWGFRLTGGTDFGTAITIIKVTKDGVAERAGLRVGDMLVKLNDIPLVDKSHGEATDLILDNGNSFRLSVIRGSFELPPHVRPPTNEASDFLEIVTPLNSRSNSIVAPEPLVVSLLSKLPPMLANMIAEGLEEQENKQDGNEAVASGGSEGADGVGGAGANGAGARGAAAKGAAADEAGAQGAGANGAGAQGASAKGAGADGAGANGAAANGAAANGAGAQGAAAKGAGADGAGANGEGADGEKPHIEYTEDEIAEMMSGCAEVLMGKCIGVDFQKLPPDTDIMKSEVLNALIEDKMDRTEKKPTAFNQKPDRPRPRPPGEPETIPEPYNPLKYKSTKKKEEPVSQQVVEPTTDSTATTESVADSVAEAELIAEVAAESSEAPTENTLGETVELVDVEPEPTILGGTLAEEPNDLESQLAEIQRQLAWIIKLPVEIQTHLTFVQDQLAKIVALKAAAEAAEHAETGETKPDDMLQEDLELEAEGAATEGEGAANEGENVEPVQEELVQEEPVLEPEPIPEPIPEPAPEPKHKKDIQWKREEDEKRKPFFPLTPQPRPVQLPGGRKWFAPKDVYTEEFIAETISGKEEVIVGTTMGVDFHKFERNYDHLKNSPVYKMVHNEDQKRRSPGFFRNREVKDHAKEDYINPLAGITEVPPTAS